MLRIIILVLLLNILYPIQSGATTNPSGGTVPTAPPAGGGGHNATVGDPGSTITIPTISDPTEDLIEQICEFRQMFCGGVGIFFVMITVTFIGILVLMNKVNWGFVVIMIGASAIFLNADQFATIFVDDSVAIDCSCL